MLSNKNIVQFRRRETSDPRCVNLCITQAWYCTENIAHTHTHTLPVTILYVCVSVCMMYVGPLNAQTDTYGSTALTVSTRLTQQLLYNW